MSVAIKRHPINSKRLGIARKLINIDLMSSVFIDLLKNKAKSPSIW
jgi:hypothetical protein